MTIEDPERFLKAVWDWRFLRGCFPRGVSPTDMDGVVELGGYFLSLEGKTTGVPLKTGQRRMLDAMVHWNRRLGESLFTPIVFWGTPQLCEVRLVQFWPAPAFAADAAALADYVKAWAEWAEERGAIRDEEARHA